LNLYTRQGDDGTTGLYGGPRVLKDHVRVEAYATIDELNSELGLAAAGCTDDELKALIIEVQHHLFNLGGNLCGGPVAITDAHVENIERHIDRFCETLPSLTCFILPGGTELAARLHVARTKCRRAERRIVTLMQQSTVDPPVIQYVNRLSDLLFAMARRANQLAGVDDVPWQRDDNT